jgi:hypothetical protein
VIEPTVAFPPAKPFTLQVTSVFALPVTVAVYCDEVPSVTLDAPVRATVTGGACTGVVGGTANATGRLCETDGLATLVAVIITFDD